MTGQKVIDEIADDRVRFVAELGHHATDQRARPAMPFQIDRAVRVGVAVKLGPAMRASRLFRPHFDEFKFPLELRVPHDLTAQGAPSGRDNLDHCLHCSLGSTANDLNAKVSLATSHANPTLNASTSVPDTSHIHRRIFAIL